MTIIGVAGNVSQKRIFESLSPNALIAFWNHFQEPARTCPKLALDDRVIMGHDVIRIDSEIAREEDGSAWDRIVQYYAPDLGCLLVGSSTFRTGPEGVEREVKQLELVDITIGEPDGALFLVPPAYGEMSPAVFAARSAAVEGLSANDLDIQMIQTLDLLYYDARQ